MYAQTCYISKSSLISNLGGTISVPDQAHLRNMQTMQKIELLKIVDNLTYACMARYRQGNKVF